MSAADVHIGDRPVGSEQPAYVVADAGVNHDGRLDLARRLVRQAGAAGADGILFRVFRTDSFISEEAPAVRGGEADSQRNVLGRRELAPDAFRELKSLARDADLDFLATPCDRKSLEELRSLDVRALHVQSGDLTCRPFLRHVRGFPAPILLSTGMAESEEIDRAMEWMKSGDPRAPVLPLYAVTQFPAELEDLDLRSIPALADRFGPPVGFHDRTTGTVASQVAVSFGAAVVLKGLTLDRDSEGPEHQAGLEPEPFYRFVRGIREVEEGLGDGTNAVTDRERELRPNLRRSLALRRTMEAGERIEEEDLIALRPATGLPAAEYHEVVGTSLTTAKRAGEILRAEDIE